MIIGCIGRRILCAAARGPRRPARAAARRARAAGHRQTIHYEIQRYICTEMCTFGACSTFWAAGRLACAPGA
eukprot:COSAG01_NODE_5330_length_4331_cov_3.389178_1_plen_71_part_10